VERKIRVLRIINRFNIGGPTYNATFLTAFLGEDYETMLVGGLPDVGEQDSLYIPRQYGVEPHLIKEMVRLPNLRSDREAYRKLKEIIREFKPDIVHTHASKAGALGRRAARACKVPVVVHTFHGHVFHSYFGKLKTMLFKAIERNLARKSDAIIAISEIQKHELSEIHRICPAKKVHVVPLGFDLEPFHTRRTTERARIRESYRIAEDEIALAIIGRLAPVKNHALFFDAMEQVLNGAKERLRIFVVGDGTLKDEVAARAAKLNAHFGPVIELTSWITDIASFNAGMDIICLSSLNEGTPVSLIEAQAGGVPVVTTDVGGVSDVVAEGKTGFIVPSGDVDAFAERILRLVNDEKKRLEMSQNGWNFVKEKFQYEILVRNVDNLYRKLLVNKGYEV
jgi:glycosyltransferase involved in cell wall biosynthesis